MFIKYLFFFAFIAFLASLIYSTRISAISHKFKVLKVRGIIKSADQWLRASIEEKHTSLQSKEASIRRLLHANTAHAYLSVARYLMSDSEIAEIVDNYKNFINIIEMENKHSIENI
jgi:hypothetical protein